MASYDPEMWPKHCGACGTSGTPFVFWSLRGALFGFCHTCRDSGRARAAYLTILDRARRRRYCGEFKSMYSPGAPV